MSDYFAVIGAGFGDEGKGLATDFISYNFCYSGNETVVVRYSGGAQAGHTVKIGDDVRHVFHHFGSGTLRGNATFLGRRFIVNPFLFCRERRELERLLKSSKLDWPAAPEQGMSGIRFIVDQRCRVTTPADMLLNEIVESSRGDSRHGSCGVGIFETTRRYETYGGMRFGDMSGFSTPHPLIEHATEIAREYVPLRMAELGLNPDDFPQHMEYINSREIAESWALEFLTMRSNVEVAESAAVVGNDFEDVIYEGSQGLLLDMDNVEFFPHLTPTKTGSPYIVEMIKEGAPIPQHVVYVTRTYMTRHGAGPFPTETSAMSYHDETNAPNAWQGELRFGDLDLDLIRTSVEKDKREWDGLGAASPAFKLFTTHHDQTQPGSSDDMFEHWMNRSREIAASLGLKKFRLSAGDTCYDTWAV